MLDKIIAFFMSIIYFILGLLGLGGDSNSENQGSKIDTTNAIVYENLAYGSESRQIVDLAIPDDASGDIGLVLLIHGGAWIGGDKSLYAETVSYCANSLGIAAASINYRYLSDDIDLNDIVEDIDSALKAIKAKGDENGVNINKVLLTGASAGAHLSMLYAYSQRTTAPITPVAVFSYCGPTDLYDDNFYNNNSLGSTATMCELMSKACGQQFTIDTKENAKDALAKVSPITYVDENTVPTAICHGQKDSIVPYSNATSIVEKFEQYGVNYDFIIYPNSDHDLGSDPEQAQQANDLLYQYASTYLN